MLNISKPSVKDKVGFLFFVFLLILMVWNMLKSSNDGYWWASPVNRHKASVSALWSLSNIYIEHNWHQSLITAHNNKLIVLGSNNISQPASVMAFEGTSGQLIWGLNYSGTTITSMESKVIVGGTSRVMALDIQNGSTLWSTFVQANVVDIIPKDKQLYIYGVSVRSYVLDVSNGHVLEKLEKPYSLEQAESWGNVAYTHDGNGDVIATNKSNSHELWRNQANVISNLAVTPTYIYALEKDGSLLWFNSQTGQKESQLLFASTVFTPSSEQTSFFAYYIAIDTETNILFVYLGDSAQLFAFQLPIP